MVAPYMYNVCMYVCMYVCIYVFKCENIAFICKKYYAQVLLKELGLLSATSNTYERVNNTLHNILQQQNNTLDSVF